MGSNTSSTQSSQSTQTSTSQIISKSKQPITSSDQLMASKQSITLTQTEVSSKSTQLQIQQCLQNIIKNINELKTNPLVQQILYKRHQFGQHVCKPMCQLYKDIPQDLTMFKFNLINQYGYQERLRVLGLCSIIAGILAFRKVKAVNIPSAAFKSLRDAAVVYFGFGLIVAPEIYNPLMSSQ